MAVVSLKQIRRALYGGLICVALSFSPQTSFASEDSAVTVNVNMARILRIGSPAATVIIGNPGVADVTIQDPQTLVLTGRSYGHTNLIVLDNVGNPIADVVIKVISSQTGFVTVYQGSSRTTLACAPNCQPVIMLGDDTDYTANSIASSSMVASSANQ